MLGLNDVRHLAVRVTSPNGACPDACLLQQFVCSDAQYIRQAIWLASWAPVPGREHGRHGLATLTQREEVGGWVVWGGVGGAGGGGGGGEMVCACTGCCWYML